MEFCRMGNRNEDKYNKEITTMIVDFDANPLEITTTKFDMRYVFRKKSGVYSFINPVVQSWFYNAYLSDDALRSL